MGIQVPAMRLHQPGAIETQPLVWEQVEIPDPGLGQVRLRIGAALQSAALDLQQTGAELLRQQGRYYGLTNSEIDARMVELSALVDIGDALNQRIKTYSGGMKRRVDLAAALIHNPEVLFLDEPTTGLDPASRAKVWEEVQRLNQDLGMTIFLTTQYLEEADQLADDIVVVDHGRIIEHGTALQLKERAGAASLVLTVSHADDLSAAAAVLRRSGNEVFIESSARRNRSPMLYWLSPDIMTTAVSPLRIMVDMP